MSVASPSAVYARRPGSADLPGGAPRTLADEHALLLAQVAGCFNGLLYAFVGALEALREQRGTAS